MRFANVSRICGGSLLETNIRVSFKQGIVESQPQQLFTSLEMDPQLIGVFVIPRVDMFSPPLRHEIRVDDSIIERFDSTGSFKMVGMASTKYLTGWDDMVGRAGRFKMIMVDQLILIANIS